MKYPHVKSSLHEDLFETKAIGGFYEQDVIKKATFIGTVKPSVTYLHKTKSKAKYYSTLNDIISNQKVNHN